MIDFYYAPTPNGWKVAIMLAEVALPHRTILLKLTEGEQLMPEFLRINPNAKIPAIVDKESEHGPLSVFESGAILLYLSNKSGLLGAGSALEQIKLQQFRQPRFFGCSDDD